MKAFDSLPKIIAFLLSFIVCFGLIIPSFGFAYYRGYAGAFGLDARQFPLALPDVWMNSLQGAFEFARAIPGYLLPLPLLALLALFGFIYWLSLNFLRSKMRPLPRKVARRRLFGDTRFPVLFFSAPAFFLLAAMAYMGVLLSGQAKAKRHIAEYRVFGCLTSDCVSYSNPGDPRARNYRGLLAAASATHVAILDNTGLSVIARDSAYVLTRRHKELIPVSKPGR